MLVKTESWRNSLMAGLTFKKYTVPDQAEGILGDIIWPPDGTVELKYLEIVAVMCKTPERGNKIYKCEIMLKRKFLTSLTPSLQNICKCKADLIFIVCMSWKFSFKLSDFFLKHFSVLFFSFYSVCKAFHKHSLMLNTFCLSVLVLFLLTFSFCSGECKESFFLTEHVWMLCV